MKNRNLVVGTFVIAGIVFTTGCVGKFHHGDVGSKLFSKYDTNEDGYLSKKEHLEVALKRFNRSDNNDDKRVTKEELKETRIAKMIPNFVDNYFETNDLNKDGFVTKNEIVEQTKKEFIQSDKNRDNRLTQVEMKSFKMESRFDLIDKNRDGVISKDEYKKQKSPFSNKEK